MKNISRHKASVPGILADFSDLEVERCISTGMSTHLGFEVSTTIRQSVMLGAKQSLTLELFTSDADADLGALRGVSDRTLAEWLGDAFSHIVGTPLLVVVRRRAYERPARHGAHSTDSVRLTILVGEPEDHLAVVKTTYSAVHA
jgi:hypothetical protein